MIPMKKALKSSVGQKVVMAISGFALIGFIITHLLGNLAFYNPNPDIANGYTKQLHDLGVLLYAAEIGLLMLFVVHVALAIYLRLTSVKRGQDYAKTQRSQGGESKFGLFANNMIISGIILLVFLVLHVWHFKFGPGLDAGYVTTLDGKEARDLYRLVAEEFAKPPIAAAYMAVMLFLGAHLRHGFWSAFQSLGALHPGYSKQIYALAAFLAAFLVIGFMGIPLWFLLDIPGSMQ
jgi:succinate dehydrogenase / fumarate reductase, cytochrome b subunit